jgi:hypothetical protein
VSASFYLEDIQLHYVQGLALVAWIEEHRGRGAVLSLLKAYADAGGNDLSYDPDTATPAILRETLGMTPAAPARAGYAELNATSQTS